MSELVISSGSQATLKRKLLCTASVLTIFSFGYGMDNVIAAESDAPAIWIELGGQLEQLNGGSPPFIPAFSNAVTGAGFTSPAALQRTSRYSNGLEGKVSIEPEGTNWVFSASVRYGRSNGSRDVQEQKTVPPVHFTILGNPGTKTAAPNYAQTIVKNSETHMVADFQAGKDVGLGLFGSGSTSLVSLGVRFAQFNSESTSSFNARPDNHFETVNIHFFSKYFPAPLAFYHTYSGSSQIHRSFRGIGPSLSWDASLPMVGNPESGEFDFDWGVNAALLFGRQRALVHHQSNSVYHYFHNPTPGTQQPTSHHHSMADHARIRSVVTPNFGGFVGVSFKFSNAKINLGYRGDFFFGAIDGGIDAAKKENLGFYGPFATVSVGLGG